MQSPLFQDNVSYLSVANFLISEEKAKLFPCKSLICFLLFLGAPYCYEAFRSLNILKEFSGLHYCLLVKVQKLVINHLKYQTEKEGFEPSRRY